MGMCCCLHSGRMLQPRHHEARGQSPWQSAAGARHPERNRGSETPAEQGFAGDCLQTTLLHRFGFRQRLKPSDRRHENHPRFSRRLPMRRIV